ncbi:MAG: acyl carrier protein [Acidimicrobiia bacterium]
MSTEAREPIREFLSEIVEDWTDDVSDDSNLFAKGLLDSLAVHEVVGFLEDEFGVVFEDADLAVTNFASVDAMVAMVNGKRSPG